MLQTNCPKCKSVIESPYLNELSSIKCGQCQEVVTVENVFVATRGFAIHREDLNNRISRYEKLLREVEAERTMMRMIKPYQKRRVRVSTSSA
jgi:predicted nucleic-acid-binding protein